MAGGFKFAADPRICECDAGRGRMSDGRVAERYLKGGGVGQEAIPRGESFLESRHYARCGEMKFEDDTTLSTPKLRMMLKTTLLVPYL